MIVSLRDRIVTGKFLKADLYIAGITLMNQVVSLHYQEISISFWLTLLEVLFLFDQPDDVLRH